MCPQHACILPRAKVDSGLTCALPEASFVKASGACFGVGQDDQPDWRPSRIPFMRSETFAVIESDGATGYGATCRSKAQARIEPEWKIGHSTEREMVECKWN